MIVAGSVTEILIGILIVLAFVSFVARKWVALNGSRCIHCGHDSGITSWQARVCPACGGDSPPSANYCANCGAKLTS